jgi:hypothetical protein
VRTSTEAGRAFPPQKSQPGARLFQILRTRKCDFMRASERLLAPAAITTVKFKDEVDQASVPRPKKHFEFSDIAEESTLAERLY